MTATTDDAETGRLAAARAKVSDTAHAAIDSAGSAIGHARDAATDALASAKTAAGDAISTVKDSAGSALSGAREKTGSVAKTAADGIEGNPLVALIGGIALGAVAGALLPRSEKEAELLGPLGARLGDAARQAFAAAKEAGLDSLDEAGLNRDAVRAQVDKLLDSATKAASAAGSAAAQAARSRGR